eukprot:gene4547-biopygen9999
MSRSRRLPESENPCRHMPHTLECDDLVPTRATYSGNRNPDKSRRLSNWLGSADKRRILQPWQQRQVRRVGLRVVGSRRPRAVHHALHIGAAHDGDGRDAAHRVHRPRDVERLDAVVRLPLNWVVQVEGGRREQRGGAHQLRHFPHQHPVRGVELAVQVHEPRGLPALRRGAHLAGAHKEGGEGAPVLVLRHARLSHRGVLVLQERRLRLLDPPHLVPRDGVVDRHVGGHELEERERLDFPRQAKHGEAPPMLIVGVGDQAQEETAVDDAVAVRPVRQLDIVAFSAPVLHHVVNPGFLPTRVRPLPREVGRRELAPFHGPAVGQEKLPEPRARGFRLRLGPHAASPYPLLYLLGWSIFWAVRKHRANMWRMSARADKDEGVRSMSGVCGACWHGVSFFAAQLWRVAGMVWRGAGFFLAWVAREWRRPPSSAWNMRHMSAQCFTLLEPCGLGGGAGSPVAAGVAGGAGRPLLLPGPAWSGTSLGQSEPDLSKEVQHRARLAMDAGWRVLPGLGDPGRGPVKEPIRADVLVRMPPPGTWECAEVKVRYFFHSDGHF